MLPPPGWSDDTLSTHIDAALNRGFTTFKNKKIPYARLARIDHNFLTICKNRANSQNEPAATLLSGAHASYRTACQLIIQGHLATFFPVLRACLENSLYALHIAKNSNALEMWINRHKSNKSKGKMIAEFAIKNMLSTLSCKCNDPELSATAYRLYETCIDLGGHPNPLGVASGISIISAGNETTTRPKYLHDDSKQFDVRMKAAGVTGLASLAIFEKIFIDEFMSFGISADIRELNQEFVALQNR